MTVHCIVKLYGTLGKWVPGYSHEAGCAIHMKQPSTVADLIDHLGLPPRSVGIVSINGQMAKKTDVLSDQALIKVFHPISGG